MEPGIEATACACELLYVYIYVLEKEEEVYNPEYCLRTSLQFFKLTACIYCTSLSACYVICLKQLTPDTDKHPVRGRG